MSAGLKYLEQVSKSTFCNLDDVSIILFWRWTKDIMKEFRDGCEIFNKGKLPRFTKNQRVTTDTGEFEIIKKNVHKVKSRSYISGGIVVNLTALFYVPKGDDDIRLVCDLTALGLNDALWAPTFWMMLVDNVLSVFTKFSWF